MNNWKVILGAFVAFFICCLASHWAGVVKGDKRGYQRGYTAGFEAGYNTPHPADTSHRRDTVYIDKPAPVESKPKNVEMVPIGTVAGLQAVIDSLRANQPDSTAMSEPVEVPVEMEEKIYSGEDEETGVAYDAQVSGYRPSLDWIRLYGNTTTITQQAPAAPAKKEPIVRIGLTMGFAAVFRQSADNPEHFDTVTGPGAAVGLTITF